MTNGKWTTFGVVVVGVFMATLDSSIVNISLPAIARSFGVPLGGALEWVVIAYLVVSAAFLLTVGRLADMLGTKVIWTSGLAVFTLGSALCGASPSLGWLVGFRAIQGLGGTLLMAAGPVMLTSAFPSSERGRALGMNAIAVALGVTTGPPLGGFITDHMTWRWIFYVNLPIGALGLIAALKLLPAAPRRPAQRFDPVGTLLLGLGLAPLTGALSFARDLGWSSPWVASGIAVGTASLVLLVPYELRRPQPILDFHLFKRRVFAFSTMALVLSFMALFAVSFLMPFFLEELRGFRTQKVGAMLTAYPIAVMILSPLSGALADRIGPRWLATGGLSVAALGLGLLSTIDGGTSPGTILFYLALSGCGQACFQAPNNSALMGAAPRDRQGTASGILATSRVVGQTLSVAVAGAVFTGLGGDRAGHALAAGRLATDGPTHAALEQTFVHAFHVTLLVCAGVAALGALFSAVRGQVKSPS